MGIEPKTYNLEFQITPMTYRYCAPKPTFSLDLYGFAGAIVSLPSTMGLRSFARQSP
jgi:hypothetical protein